MSSACPQKIGVFSSRYIPPHLLSDVRLLRTRSHLGAEAVLRRFRGGIAFPTCVSAKRAAGAPLLFEDSFFHGGSFFPMISVFLSFSFRCSFREKSRPFSLLGTPSSPRGGFWGGGGGGPLFSPKRSFRAGFFPFAPFFFNLLSWPVACRVICFPASLLSSVPRGLMRVEMAKIVPVLSPRSSFFFLFRQYFFFAVVPGVSEERRLITRCTLPVAPQNSPFFVFVCRPPRTLSPLRFLLFSESSFLFPIATVPIDCEGVRGFLVCESTFFERLFQPILDSLAKRRNRPLFALAVFRFVFFLVPSVLSLQASDPRFAFSFPRIGGLVD